jgi:hypothetical protein
VKQGFDHRMVEFGKIRGLHNSYGIALRINAGAARFYNTIYI